METGVLSLLFPFTVLLGVAIGVLLLSERFGIPAVIGLLLTGILVGPHGLGWIEERATVEQLAELGVLLLLFTIGLELTGSRLRALQRSFWVGGGLQLIGTAVAAGGVLWFLGLAWREVAVLSAVVAMSSTAVVLKVLQSRGELDTPHGRSAFAILVFQDLLLVPLLVLLPWLAPRAERDATRLLEAGMAVVAAAALVWPLRRLLPRLLSGVARTRLREAFLFGSLFACFGLAYLSQELGFSSALGAFVAGVLIAETDYRWQVVSDVEPFRDLFASIFFISIGMLVDSASVLEHSGLLAALLVGTLLVKTLPAYVAVRASGFPARISWLAAVSVASIGEFSFVLLSSARSLGLLRDEVHDRAVELAAVTLLLLPFLIQGAPLLVRWLEQRLREKELHPEIPPQGDGTTWRDHVVLVGLGVGGRTVARVLREAGIAYVAIEADASLVARHREEGGPVLFGDASRLEVLRAAGLKQARVLLVAISDFEATCRILRLARELAPHAHRIVRTRRVAEAERLRAAGAQEVIAEEFESSIEIFARVLAAYHVPRNVIRAQERVLRGSDYEYLRQPRGGRALPEAVVEALAAGTTEIVGLRAGSPAVGKSLAELELRRHAGVHVLAVVRGERAEAPPAPETVLATGDQLVLVGSHEGIERALERLEGPAGSPGSEGSPPIPGF